MASTVAVGCEVYPGAVIGNCLSCALGFNLRRLPLGNCVAVSLVKLHGRKDNGAIRIVDAHPGDGKRFVRADEKLTAFVELEAVTQAEAEVTKALLLRRGAAAAIRKNSIDIVHPRLA